jgi:uncharacterized protein YkwD
MTRASLMLALPLLFVAAALDGSAASVSDALTNTHNRVRKNHGAPPLTWSPTVATSAQHWADNLRSKGCILQHSGSAKYGENLAAGTSSMMTPEHAVEMWAEEEKEYSFKKGGFSMKTGHFTQVVWKDTKSVGCGSTQCKGLTIWVCQYDPPGNVEGEYARNVQPPK